MYDKKFILGLYEAHYGLMRGKAFEILKDAALAEDAVHNAMLKLMNKTELLRTMDAGKRVSYIIQAVRNISYDYLKNRSNQFNSDAVNDMDVDGISDVRLSPEEIFILKEDYERLGQAILKLSQRDRELLYNRYSMELNDTEIARVMEIPANNLRTYISRAVKRLRKILREGGEQL